MSENVKAIFDGTKRSLVFKSLLASNCLLFIHLFKCSFYLTVTAALEFQSRPKHKWSLYLIFIRALRRHEYMWMSWVQARVSPTRTSSSCTRDWPASGLETFCDFTTASASMWARARVCARRTCWKITGKWHVFTHKEARVAALFAWPLLLMWFWGALPFVRAPQRTCLCCFSKEPFHGQQWSIRPFSL